MNNQPNRIANFTSSKIFALMSSDKTGNEFGKPALTYIRKKIIEKRIGRSSEVAAYSKTTSWGQLVEARVFDLLGLEYQIVSQQTQLHPTIEGWSGSPDLITGNSIAEIKCYYPENFCNYADVLREKNIELLKSEFPQEYWQIVSNSCIFDKQFGEAIVYLPYYNELSAIKHMAQNVDDNQQRFEWIFYANPDALPYQIEGGYYNNIERFKFEIPQDDKDLLTIRVLKAIEILNK